MIILGGKVKKIRKGLGLTQKELSKNICTQVTISKIENHNQVPSIKILTSICDRLNISVHDVCKTDPNSNSTYELFKQVDYLSSQFEHQKAYKLLTTNIRKKNLSTTDLKQYYYYKGMTLLSGFNNIKEALHNFNLALLTGRSNSVSLLDILITNAIGIAYFSSAEIDIGKEYIDRSIKDLNQLTYVTPDNTNKFLNLFYNSAKFYSELKDYTTAINLCEKGIEFLNEREFNYLLDVLLYEQGYNLYKNKQKKEAETYYFMASGMALVKKNKVLLEVIRKDCLAYKLNLSPFNLITQNSNV